MTAFIHRKPILNAGAVQGPAAAQAYACTPSDWTAGGPRQSGEPTSLDLCRGCMVCGLFAVQDSAAPAIAPLVSMILLKGPPRSGLPEQKQAPQGCIPAGLTNRSCLWSVQRAAHAPTRLASSQPSDSSRPGSVTRSQRRTGSPCKLCMHLCCPSSPLLAAPAAMLGEPQAHRPDSATK